MRPTILSAAILATITFPALQSQDLPPAQNTSALLRELDQITQRSGILGQKRRSEALSQIQSAAASPSSSADLYLAALDGTKYRDKHQEFLDWKQKNQETLHQASFQNAAQLQLRYLLLGLQRSEKVDAFAQVNATLSYLNSLQSLHFLDEPYVAAKPMKGSKPLPCPSDKVIKEAADLIAQSLPGCPVVEWLQIKDLLPDKDYHGSAGDYFGILEKNVKAPLRLKKDPRLLGVWDLQINAALTQANSSQDSQKALNFKTEKLPPLIFKKCTDTAAIGQPNRALSEMMLLLRTYPANPSVPDWIEAAKNLLTNSPVAPVANNTPVAVVAPVTTNAAAPVAQSTNTPASPSLPPAAASSSNTPAVIPSLP